MRFGYNPETAVNNAFQQKSPQFDVQTKALAEFDSFVEILRKADVDVLVVEDTPEPHTPDSIFPNNWVSFHGDGTVILYPMFALNRRAERQKNVLRIIKDEFDYEWTDDLTGMELTDQFLEGTGSLVLDRKQKVAYVCISPRTDEELALLWCNKQQYTPCLFDAVDEHNEPIYHTNVMMCIADEYAVVCLECIPDLAERNELEQKLEETDKTIIPISLEQMRQFAGNMLQVTNKKGEKLLVMSSRAYHSLSIKQENVLLAFNPIIHSPLDTIETNGGGSARCMMAEVYLDRLPG
ncbi:hypothetical protein SAMN05216436_111126 [bacterium A37T11]|nr:hypothetical protein SAMN05216436_111126 [bacterium A37T11]